MHDQFDIFQNHLINSMRQNLTMIIFSQKKLSGIVVPIAPV